jgi:hypothetical protein
MHFFINLCFGWDHSPIQNHSFMIHAGHFNSGGRHYYHYLANSGAVRKLIVANSGHVPVYARNTTTVGATGTSSTLQ